jgi:hypothetical protein
VDCFLIQTQKRTKPFAKAVPICYTTARECASCYPNVAKSTTKQPQNNTLPYNNF